MSGLIWVQSVCIGYEQAALEGKELKIQGQNNFHILEENFKITIDDS